MATPITKMTTAGLNAILTTQLGSLKPYQLDQVQDVLNRLRWNRGSNSDITAQPTITQVVTALGSNNP